MIRLCAVIFKDGKQFFFLGTSKILLAKATSPCHLGTTPLNSNKFLNQRNPYSAIFFGFFSFSSASAAGVQVSHQRFKIRISSSRVIAPSISRKIWGAEYTSGHACPRAPVPHIFQVVNFGTGAICRNICLTQCRYDKSGYIITLTSWL